MLNKSGDSRWSEGRGDRLGAWLGVRLRELWNDSLDLIFPRWCAGCGAWDEDLCEQCRAEFAVTWNRVEEYLPYLSHVDPDGGPDTSPFPVFAVAEYSGAPARAIVRWKNVSDQRLDDAFTALVERTEFPYLPAHSRRLAVVPAPSSPSRSRQGRFVAGVLGKAIAHGLDGTYANVLRRRSCARSLLTQNRACSLVTQNRARLPFIQGRAGSALAQSRIRSALTQGRGLDARGRKSRSVTTATGTDLGGWDVVLVDDVVTTGATLAGAARVVQGASGRVVAAFVLAATNDPRQLRALNHTREGLGV